MYINNRLIALLEAAILSRFLRRNLHIANIFSKMSMDNFVSKVFPGIWILGDFSNFGGQTCLTVSGSKVCFLKL